MVNKFSGRKMEYFILFAKKLFDILVMGIFVGLIVSYLLNTPVISLINTYVDLKEDRINIAFDYENKGKSPAINVSVKCLYGIDGTKTKDFILVDAPMPDRIGIGDAFSYECKDLPLSDNNAVVLTRVKFNDTSKIREIINKKLFSGNPYMTYKCFRYVKGKSNLSVILKEQKDRYEKELLSILKRSE